MEEITIRDIARICDVGVSTVSRAINNHPDINPETKQMIMRVISEQGYVPNNSARNLKRTDAKCIAVLVKGMSNPFFTTMIKILEDEIRKKKYSMVLHHVEFDENEIDVALELVKEKRLNGIVFLGGYFNQSEEKLAMLKVPFILSTVGSISLTIGKQNYSSISVDDEKESYRMTKYLIQAGHKKIAMISASGDDESIGHLRYEGYKRALEESHIPLTPKIVCPMKSDIESYSMENGYAVAKELLESGEEFTAIFAISDTLAVGALRAIAEAGKCVPEDYSLVGFDGIELGRFVVPNLTTIAQPVEEMAEETVKLLFNVLAGKKEHAHKIFPGQLLVRESSTQID